MAPVDDDGVPPPRPPRRGGASPRASRARVRPGVSPSVRATWRRRLSPCQRHVREQQFLHGNCILLRARRRRLGRQGSSSCDRRLEWLLDRKLSWVVRSRSCTHKQAMWVSPPARFFWEEQADVCVPLVATRARPQPQWRLADRMQPQPPRRHCRRAAGSRSHRRASQTS